MSRSDIFLQCIFIGMTGVVLFLLTVKLYPSKIIANYKAAAFRSDTPIIRSIPVNLHTSIPKRIPKSISIRSISIDLAIEPGVITDNKWTLYEDKASWLSTSQTPGYGNVILYAHNKIGLFGSLEKVDIDDEIILSDSTNTYIYKVVEKRKINPTDVDTIVSDRNQLTIYTCNGIFDEKRLVVVALPKTL